MYFVETIPAKSTIEWINSNEGFQKVCVPETISKHGQEAVIMLMGKYEDGLLLIGGLLPLLS